jgi:hypothetical protein
MGASLQWVCTLTLVAGLEYFNDPLIYTGRVTHAGQVEGEKSDWHTPNPNLSCDANCTEEHVELG